MPAWTFTVAELTVLVRYVAVAPAAITAPPEPDIEVDPALTTVDAVTADDQPPADARRLTIHYTTGACLESHRALGYESANVVVVGAEAIDSDGSCTANAVFQRSPVDLAAPLGDRVLLDAATGRPIAFRNCGDWQITGC